MISIYPLNSVVRFFNILWELTKPFIPEILTTQLDTAEPEIAKKTEIFEFIQIFNSKKLFFLEIFLAF